MHCAFQIANWRLEFNIVMWKRQRRQIKKRLPAPEESKDEIEVPNLENKGAELLA